MTFEAWVYPETDIASTILAFYSYQNSGEHTIMRELSYSGANDNHFCYFEEGVEICNSFSQIVPGNWYHIAVTIDEDYSVVLYVDGVAEPTFYANQKSNKVSLFGIGGSYNIDKAFDDPKGCHYRISSSMPFQWKGKVDEVRIWNYVRHKEDIQASMYAPMHGDKTGLVALWHFDESEDTYTAYDATMNGHDGVLFGYSSDDTCFEVSKKPHLSYRHFFFLFFTMFPNHM
ncbi:LamG domain-containing protein [Thermodesulfobacteriota bacterium]